MNNKHRFNYRHLNVAHNWLNEYIRPGMNLLDATCGNGHDSLFLATKLFAEENVESKLTCIDIQEQAIDQTKEKLYSYRKSSQVEVLLYSHSDLVELKLRPLDCVIYNLGYLPGSDKQITTQVLSTLESIKQSMNLLKNGGAISLMCYPGHDEGLREYRAICEFLKSLDSTKWGVCLHEWINRKRSPAWILIEKCL